MFGVTVLIYFVLLVAISIGVVLRPLQDLQRLDDFLRKEERIPNPQWPWASAEEFRARLEEARREVAPQDLSPA